MLDNKTMGIIIERLRALIKQQPFEVPIRDEIFSTERLEQFAAFLAQQLPVTKKIIRGRSLLPRVENNNHQIVQAYKIFSSSIEKGHTLPPAAEWLIDNFHIIEDQIREIREDLPEKFYLELPKMSQGELALYPRVYGIALSLIAHTDSRIESETLKRFVRQFQNVSPLTVGEIWAIAIVLRIALVENLCRVIQQVLFTHEINEQINEVADQILEKIEESSAEKVLQDLELIKKSLGYSEVADSTIILQLLKRLRDQHISVFPICENLDQHLASKNKTLEQVLHIENQFQAAAQVTVGNIITSMRLISNIDWEDFFESVNLIDPILAQDPANAYSTMDFTSRDRYRHAVEKIAKRTKVSEQDVAHTAVRLAQNYLPGNDLTLAGDHVGFYLFDKGLRQLEKLFGYRQRPKEIILRNFSRHATVFYIGTLSFLVIIALLPLAYYLMYLKSTKLEWLLTIVSAFFPIVDSCVALLNLIVTRIIPPRILSKIDLSHGIPAEAKTFVVIPTIFSNADFVLKMTDFLETRYLSNPDENLYFAILSDFRDSQNKNDPDDIHLLQLAKEKIKELNERYPSQELKFYLFHRERRWNESEKKWIGWERKRGKLQEFNQFLRGAKDTSFIEAPSFSNFFLKIHYVITLDSDTHLPRGSAKKLIGTILHPLNYPQLNKEKNQVVSGYGILQPRISITPESSGRSLFSRIFSGNTGIDPYTKAVSDVYQDLFGEGSFTGKGLYVVDAFEATMAGRVPENTLLSHDLLEGLFCRSALVTDIEFLDDYPSHYEAFSKRQHRWTRGDWQLLPWLPQKTLSFISHWKIIDNLRRSLVAPLVLLWLVLGWTVLPGSPVVWTLSVLIFLALPPYAHAANSFLFHSGDTPWTSHFWNIWGDVKTNTAQIILMLACVVHQAYLQIDAIFRTLFRLFISRKNLLQWVTAAEEESKLPKHSLFSKSIFVPSVLITLVLLGLLALVNLQALFIAGIFLIIWILFPWIAEYISRPEVEKKYEPNQLESELLRKIARKTWNFYETFVNDKDHWLIPDNFQVDPKPIIAHRTSPTNMGLLLLATCSAYDFGYITKLELADRLEKTFSTLLRLELWKGHFYNWYDTQSLTPLFPKYISTVDSGNLAGHLLAVKQACLEMAQEKISLQNYSSVNWAGLADTLLIIKEKLSSLKKYYSSNHLEIIHQKIENVFKLIETKADIQKISAEYQVIHQEILKTTSTSQVAGSEHIEPWSQKFLSMISEIDQFTKKISDEKFAENLRLRFQKLAEWSQDLFMKMDFTFLYDQQRKVFTIGYNVSDGQLDNAFYDLLASESRLTSFIAISKGNVPQSHWFHLGRQMTSLFQKRALVSWSASMFEYLMPLLVMRNYPESLLHETHLAVIHQQKVYSDKLGIPWGISESGYNARDLQMNYQYGPFGVPGLGLKRGLRDDQVVSPYSTVLAIMISAKVAIQNLKRLIKEELLTDFGFYEAVDFTQNRLPPNQTRAVIKSFMAHHQGMILVSLNNFFNLGVMQNRFHKDEMIRSSELLLQERVPRKVVMSHLRAEELHSDQFFLTKTKSAMRTIPDVQTLNPVTQVLSNGKYTVLLTAAGSGFSRYENMAVTRWQEDSTRDCYGTFFYIHDHLSGSIWSATKQPFKGNARSYSAIFSEHKAEYRCQNDDCGTLMEVVVSAEDNVETRRITLTNLTDKKRLLEITSYLEPILTTQEADLAHSAFSNLFIETEFIHSKNALLAHRRKRSGAESDSWGIHLVSSEMEEVSAAAVQYETHRAHFIGRGRDNTFPEALVMKKPLSDTSGFVLDPCLSLRKKIILEPHASAKVSFTTGVAPSREEALRLIDQYQDPHAFKREEEMAWTREQMDLRHLNIEASEAEVFQSLCSALIYSNKLARPSAEILQSNQSSQSALWAYGLSGDLPIMIVGLSRGRDMALIKQLLRFHSRMRMKNIAFDLVLISEEKTGYRLELYEEILQQIRSSGSGTWLNKNGGIFLLRRDSLPDKDWILLQSVARIYFVATELTLKEMSQRLKANQRAERLPFKDQSKKQNWKNHPLKIPPLQFYNGMGGFSEDGKEYIIHIVKGKIPPMPWINVIANEKEFGFLISEIGSAYTWSANSRENRLTPWNNDPISDSPGEMIYIQDKVTGEFWSPTPSLRAENGEYLVRHGQGYTSFEHNSHEIETQLLMFVPIDQELKIHRLQLKNRSAHSRTLEITSYIEWVLGVYKSKTAPTVITKKGESPNIFQAKNPFSIEFSDRVAFAATSEKISSFTCDRKSFLGRHGHFRDPQGLRSEKLRGEIGAGWDPCLAMKVEVSLKPNETKEIFFLMGQTSDEPSIKPLVEKFLKKESVHQSFDKMAKFWNDHLSKFVVRTPFPEMDILVNHWLLYQTLACRVWARSAFYQSGGAFGFRDQLQDAMALIYVDPKLAREQICRAAAHQFLEGDVLHWWHPPKDKGVRTHFSDDLLWLPFVVSFYIQTTKDESILKENIFFLEAENIPPGREDIYIHPKISAESGSVFEHCLRAIDRSLKVGKHGLPLMGGGDWNDGMNHVGLAGQGESVWMAWFLGTVLKNFLPLCQKYSDHDHIEKYNDHLSKLQNSVENEGWDGRWYKRAFFDDGTPLGSNQNDECKIDSLVQSWAAISKLGNKEHTKIALQAVDEYLINRKDKLIQLFTPPFDKTLLDPGYIKGYLPGVRENGGQYTHAAVWVAMAFASIGEGEKAIELLNLLNPINHSNSLEAIQKYKVEPYVIAADVYAVDPYVGRGGWTWYTGSAGWYYRAFIESILGIHLRGNTLIFEPCLAKTLTQYEVSFQYEKGTTYEIIFENKILSNEGHLQVSVDGVIQKGNTLELIDDGRKHQVNLLLMELNNYF